MLSSYIFLHALLVLVALSCIDIVVKWKLKKWVEQAGTACGLSSRENLIQNLVFKVRILFSKGKYSDFSIPATKM